MRPPVPAYLPYFPVQKVVLPAPGMFFLLNTCNSQRFTNLVFISKSPQACAQNIGINPYQADPYAHANRVICCWQGGFKRRTHPQTEECWHCPAGVCDNYDITFFEAANICAAAGMRLCTVEEIRDMHGRGEGCDSGCNTNEQEVWVTDSCGAGYVDGSGYTSGIPSTCQHSGFAGTCTTCPANSVSPSGSTTVEACLCASGYGYHPDEPQPCTDCFTEAHVSYDEISSAPLSNK